MQGSSYQHMYSAHIRCIQSQYFALFLTPRIIAHIFCQRWMTVNECLRDSTSSSIPQAYFFLLLCCSVSSTKLKLLSNFCPFSVCFATKIHHPVYASEFVKYTTGSQGFSSSIVLGNFAVLYNFCSSTTRCGVRIVTLFIYFLCGNNISQNQQYTNADNHWSD